MGNFNRGPRHGGGDRGDRGRGGFGDKKFGGKPSFGGGRPIQMHPAICNTCGKECEVPFRPTGNRPIFCSMCFQKQGNVSPGGRERSFDRPRFEDRPKPSFHSDNGGGSSRGLEELKTQMTQMNAKLDRILSALNASTSTAPEAPKKQSKLEEMMGIGEDDKDATATAGSRPYGGKDKVEAPKKVRKARKAKK